MEQLILHLIGDYVTQSHYMATNKTKRHFPAAFHAIVYSLPFLLLGPSWTAFAVILGTHFLIDRYRLARLVVYAKNIVLDPCWGVDKDLERILSKNDAESKDTYEWMHALRWENCKATGYPSESPAWLSVWLLIAADNTLHLAINYAALRWL